MSARVVVTIPCFDDGPVLAEAVGSVAEDEPVDVVVVDDGSSDPATLEVLSALEAAGTRVLRQANAGPGAARMAGARASDAPYVFPLDADDLLVPGALRVMADALDAAPDAGLAWGDYELFGDYDGFYRSPREWLPWSLTYVNQYPICSLIRRTALERAGGWGAGTRFSYEDWSLWLRFVELGIGGVGVGQAVYRRRLHGGGGRIRDSRAKHGQLYRQLRADHPDAFSRRAELRRAEGPAAWKPLVYPVLFGRRAVVPYRVEAWLQRLMLRRGLEL